MIFNLQLDVVERFVVVHGQIILNQFAHFPTKAVRESAFATMLKQRMEARRHSKLYMSKVKGGSKAVVKTRTANPMKVGGGGFWDMSSHKNMTGCATALLSLVCCFH